MFTTNLIVTLAAGVLGLLFNILMAIAVEQDCRARNIKAKTTYSLLTFFFPIIVGVVYACTRKNAQKISDEPVPNAQKLAKKSVALFVVAVIAFIAAGGLQIYSIVTAANDYVDGIDDIAYYDMKGNEYENIEEVLLYDADGNVYEYSLDENSYVNRTTGDSYDSYMCYVTKDGYFYYDEDGSIEASDDYSSYVDTDGTEYYLTSGVYWTADGEMTNSLDNALSGLFE